MEVNYLSQFDIPSKFIKTCVKFDVQICPIAAIRSVDSRLYLFLHSAHQDIISLTVDLIKSFLSDRS